MMHSTGCFGPVRITLALHTLVCRMIRTDRINVNYLYCSHVKIDKFYKSILSHILYATGILFKKGEM